MIHRNVPGDAGADVAAVALERRDLAVHRARGDREADGEREDDRRVAEREEEADAEGPLPCCDQLARRVVDRGDVIGVEGVPQAEDVRRQAEPDQRPVAAE